jgi:hypothetical protein
MAATNAACMAAGSLVVGVASWARTTAKELSNTTATTTKRLAR